MFRVGLALADYHHAHGEYPESLDALDLPAGTLPIIKLMCGDDYGYQRAAPNAYTFQVSEDESN